MVSSHLPHISLMPLKPVEIFSKGVSVSGRGQTFMLLLAGKIHTTVTPNVFQLVVALFFGKGYSWDPHILSLSTCMNG